MLKRTLELGRDLLRGDHAGIDPYRWDLRRQKTHHFKVVDHVWNGGHSAQPPGGPALHVGPRKGALRGTGKRLERTSKDWRNGTNGELHRAFPSPPCG